MNNDFQMDSADVLQRTREQLRERAPRYVKWNEREASQPAAAPAPQAVAQPAPELEPDINVGPLTEEAIEASADAEFEEWKRKLEAGDDDDLSTVETSAQASQIAEMVPVGTERQARELVPRGDGRDPDPAVAAAAAALQGKGRDTDPGAAYGRDQYGDPIVPGFTAERGISVDSPAAKYEPSEKIDRANYKTHADYVSALMRNGELAI